MSRRFNLVGPGRAGGALRLALASHGWECAATFGRNDDVSAAADGVELCVIATPDAVIADMAAAITPSDAVLMHLSGATPLSALGGHRCAAMHPLTSLATPETGAVSLGECFFAIAGHELAEELATALSGKWFEVADEDRALYHAAAAVASNHLVAMLGQVERLANEIGVPFEAFLPLVHASLDNTVVMGAADALTGPVARGDETTIEKHRDAIGDRLPDELEAYDAGVNLARKLR